MTKTIKAIYEHGVLRPLDPLEGIEESGQVDVKVLTDEERQQAFRRLAGSISSEDADEMMRIIDEEFERVNPDEWSD